jgi:hypothetical protein
MKGTPSTSFKMHTNVMMNIRIITFFAYSSMHAIHGISSLIIISPPSSFGEYRQLASLLVGTFDDLTSDFATKASSNNHQRELRFKIDTLQWNLFEKSLTVEHTCNKYTSTARRMQGKKYCVLIAKECIQYNDNNQQLRVRDDVIGMVEMGMSLCPVLSNFLISKHGDLDDAANATGLTGNIELSPQPTVGVLCVKSSHQKKGVGQALIHKCEQVAANVWNEPYLFVDIEPNNHNTLRLFEKWGYEYTLNETGEAQKRNITVSRRRIERSRLHYLLRKELDRTVL